MKIKGIYGLILLSIQLSYTSFGSSRFLPEDTDVIGSAMGGGTTGFYTSSFAAINQNPAHLASEGQILKKDVYLKTSYSDETITLKNALIDEEVSSTQKKPSLDAMAHYGHKYLKKIFFLFFFMFCLLEIMSHILILLSINLSALEIKCL